MSEYDNQLIHYSSLSFTIKHAHNAIHADRFHCMTCLLAHKVLRANVTEFLLQFLATIDSLCHLLFLHVRLIHCLPYEARCITQCVIIIFAIIIHELRKAQFYFLHSFIKHFHCWLDWFIAHLVAHFVTPYILIYKLPL